MISSEEIYDKEVSPLVDKLAKLCGQQMPPIPILVCSTFWSEKYKKEVSCCSAVLNGSESLRMREIAQIIMRKGKTPMSVMAKMMLGKPTEQDLDANWYKSNEKLLQCYQGQVCSYLMQIRDLVEDTYHFPTALIVQTPTPGKYIVIGRHSSNTYDGIQFARVIALHGYTQEASTMLLGGDTKLSEQLSSITRHLAPGERVVIPPEAAPKSIRKQVGRIVPLLRGGTPPPPPTREEIKISKLNAKDEQEARDNSKRKRAVLKKKREKSAPKKKKAKREGRWKTTNILNLV